MTTPGPHPSLEDQPRQRAYPLVSVVLATRGRPELVRETLRSVVSQQYAGPIECLVVHDQEPPDETLTAYSVEDRDVRVYTNRHTPGLAGARNTGLEESIGEFVATCDDDDTWHSSKLNRQIDLLTDYPDFLAVGAGIRLMLPEGRVVEWPGRQDQVPLNILVRNRVKELHSSTLVMRRDAFAKAGRYDESLPHGYAEDYDFVLRLARVGRIGVVRQPLADIRKDVQSWFRERSSNTAEALTYLLDRHPEIRSDRRGHARVLGQVAFAQSSLGRRRDALHNVTRALQRYPLAPHAYLALIQITTGVDPMRLLRAARMSGRGLS